MCQSYILLFSCSQVSARKSKQWQCVVSQGYLTFKDPDRGGVVVHPAGSAQSSGDDRGRGDEIVCEGVVEISLQAMH